MTATGLVDVGGEVAPDLEMEERYDVVEIRTALDQAKRTIWSRATLTPSAANRLVDGEDLPGFVIADMIDSAAEETLRSAGWSYWDRRGRLRMWLPEIGVRLDVPTRSYVTGADGPDPRRPVVGVGGISVALGLLERPGEPPGVREIARRAEMSPSTISRARQQLTHVALIDSDGRPVVPELFWATSDAWVVEPVSVAAAPEGDGWVLGGDAAAAKWGAQVFGISRRYYCADRAAFDRHRLRHRADGSTIQIAMPASPSAIASAVGGTVHPVVAALDLSTTARGREILEDWVTIESGSADAEVVWR